MITDADNNEDKKIDLNEFKEIMRLAKWLFSVILYFFSLFFIYNFKILLLLFNF